jgi:hypothetical protein
MKNITLSIVAVIMAFVTVSCNQTSNKSEKSSNDSAVLSEEQSSAQPKENDTVTTTAVADTSKGETVKTVTTTFSIAPIITDYLSLKNALASDNDKAAANAGKQLFITLKNVDMKTIPANKHKEYMDIAENAKENAEHIGDNAGKIDHQREHLASLSKDVSDLIALFGTTQKLYQDYCPMYNDGKGAIWISEAKTIKNPYYGSKMLTCGSVKKEF